MKIRKSDYLEAQRGILFNCFGSTPMFIIQKNGVMRIKKENKKKNA